MTTMLLVNKEVLHHSQRLGLYISFKLLGKSISAIPWEEGSNTFSISPNSRLLVLTMSSASALNTYAILAVSLSSSVSPGPWSSSSFSKALQASVSLRQQASYSSLSRWISSFAATISFFRLAKWVAIVARGWTSEWHRVADKG